MAHTDHPRTRLTTIARERSDYRITGQFVDAVSAVIPGATLSTLELTLYADDAAATLINSVDHVNINNVGRGTVDSSGNLVITLGPSDNPILDDTLVDETHVALVEWTYNNGLSAGRQELAFRVWNMVRVT